MSQEGFAQDVPLDCGEASQYSWRWSKEAPLFFWAVIGLVADGCLTLSRGVLTSAAPDDDGDDDDDDTYTQEGPVCSWIER